MKTKTWGINIATLSPAHSLLSHITMAKRYSAEETLHYLLQSSDEEGTVSVSEEDDLTEADPNYLEEDEEAEEEAEEDLEEREGPQTLPSKNREDIRSTFELFHKIYATAAT